MRQVEASPAAILPLAVGDTWASEQKVRTCSIEGCERQVRARGWCWAHYQRWHKHGDVRAHIPTIERITSDHCEASGCEKPRFRRNRWCGMHLTRLQKYGSLDGHAPNGSHWRTGCSVGHCKRKHRAKGYCDFHYMRFWRNGHPHPRCTIIHCREPHQARGYCQRHYNSWKHRGDPLAVERAPLQALDGPARNVPPDFVRELVRPPIEFMRDIERRLAEVANDRTLKPWERSQLVCDLTDELIRASCGKGHRGKADILTKWKQDEAWRHEVYVSSGVPDPAEREGNYHRARGFDHLSSREGEAGMRGGSWKAAA
jgi:hypothetical protein